MKKVDVDDRAVAIIRFKNGAIGTYEASCFCAECKNYLAFEVNGFKESLTFNLEQLNVLDIYRKDSNGRIREPREVLVTESNQLFCSAWWPPGHILGWEHAHNTLTPAFPRGDSK
jgi:predicted dehydrogenase